MAAERDMSAQAKSHHRFFDCHPFGALSRNEEMCIRNTLQDAMKDRKEPDMSLAGFKCCEHQDYWRALAPKTAPTDQHVSVLRWLPNPVRTQMHPGVNNCDVVRPANLRSTIRLCRTPRHGDEPIRAPCCKPFRQNISGPFQLRFANKRHNMDSVDDDGHWGRTRRQSSNNPGLALVGMDHIRGKTTVTSA